MPPSKKRKTGPNASASTRDDSPTREEMPTRDKLSTREDVPNSMPHEGGKEGRDPQTIPPYEYVCIHRPYFDWVAGRQYASRQAVEEGDVDENADEEDDDFGAYKKIFEEEDATGNIFEPAAEHKEWKWIILWDAWKKFGMYIYNDWKGYGMMDALNGILASFDRVLRKKDDNMCFQLWAIVSSMAHWVNDQMEGGMEFTMVDDGERVEAQHELIGCALLTTLAAINVEGELKPDSKFSDLPYVISSFLLWSSGFEAYGIEDEAIFWRPHAVEYFTRAALDPSKGVPGTEELLDKLKEHSEHYEEDTTGRSEKDPWAWGKKVRQYKKHHGPLVGGSNYDITKMSRAERARYAFDGKDPLEDISAKDIREGNLAFE